MESTSYETFNDWGERGRHKFVPVWGGDGTKISYVVQSPEGVILAASPGTESSNPRPPFVDHFVRSFLPNSVFLPCDHGLDFRHQLM